MVADQLPGAAPGAPRRRAGVLTAQPVPIPAELDVAQGRRWELFAPTLLACVVGAAHTARQTLLEDAQGASSEARRRLSFLAARELATTVATLRERTIAALVRLFVDVDSLARSWQSEVGAFALQQLCERLVRTQQTALVAMSERLGNGGPCSADEMAARLAGLLAAAIDSDGLSAHARNVVCAFHAQYLESVLPGLSGQSAAVDATRRAGGDAPAPRVRDVTQAAFASGESARIPRPVLDGLRHAQLEAMEDKPPVDMAELVQTRLRDSRAPRDANDVERAIAIIRSEQQRIESLCRDGVVPPLLAESLRLLAPVIARARLAPGGARHPEIDALIGAFLHGALDLAAGEDPRAELIERIRGDILACFRGDAGELAELVDEAVARLSALNRRQLEIRNRARTRALVERRRQAARSAADRVCARLAAREGMQPFLELGWHSALVQAHIRYGADSLPWRRMLALGQALLTSDRAELRGLRPALADALSLAIAETTLIEERLDALECAAEHGSDPTLLPSGGIPDADFDAQPIEAGAPLLMEDGSRCWLLVQPREGAGQVLISDALARRMQWLAADDLRARIATGRVRALHSAPLLETWMADAGRDPGGMESSGPAPLRTP